MQHRDADYYLRRADAERAMAARSISRAVADLHYQLAENYQRLAGEAEAAEPVSA